MKTCPYCAEEVREAALLCKHCRSDLRLSPGAARARRLVYAFALLAVGLVALRPAAASVSERARLAALPAAATCPQGAEPLGPELQLPPGHPPVQGMTGMGMGLQLPPGHPPVLRLPPGHPPIGAVPQAPVFEQDPAREL